MLTDTTWTRMSWSDRLEVLRERIGLDTDTDLATYLGVTQKTLYYWRSGLRSPRPEKELAMRRLAIPRDTPRDIDNKFVGVTTIGFDIASKMFADALATGDPVTLSMAIHCICLKLTQILLHKDTTYVPVVESLVGGKPVKETITISVPGLPQFESKIMVTHTESGSLMFVMRCSILWDGRVDRQFAFAVNDNGIAETVKRINDYVKKKL